MVTLILAAGYATRLYPLSVHTPKALFKVGAIPVVEHIVKKVEAITDQPVFVITNNKFYRQFAQWKKSSGGAKVEMVNDGTANESERRGAVGDLHFFITRKKITTDVLVVGGDNLFDWSLEGFLGYARKKKPCPAVGLYDLGSPEKASCFGVVRMDSENRIASFQEKPVRPESSLVSMCLYFFPEETLHFLNTYIALRHNPDAPGEYISWLLTQTSVYGYTCKGKWFDIGNKKTLEEAQTKFGR